MTDAELDAEVKELIGNAIENGYEFDSVTDKDLAIDLNRCAASMNDIPHARLLASVKRWRAGILRG